ncbi:MAG: DUF3857 domain-containing protein [Acidobacteriota bacterium]
MRVCAFVVLLCVAAPVARAQFQEPTKEELQMTADPKAPGAAAVYLNYEAQDLVPQNTIIHYERIKVLTEKGKELATVSIPYVLGYGKITKIEGRTIHPDGTVIPLTATPADLMDVRSKGYQKDRVTFTLPDVSVGSILEYRWEIHDTYVGLRRWRLQEKYFVHKAHYVYDPGPYLRAEGLAWTTHADGIAKVVQDKKGVFTFDISDVPPAPAEDWMPPLNSIGWRVQFYSTDAKSGSDFWQLEGKAWSQVMDQLTQPKKPIKQAVAGLVGANDSDEVKARKLYDAVQQMENDSFTREKSKAERKKEKIKDIKNVEDVLKQRRGDENDLALLYIAMAKAAGLQAYAMEVVNRDRAMFDPTYLSLYQLDTILPVVVLNGKERVLDPGQKMCPFGLVKWTHTMAGGIRQSAKGAAFGLTPPNSYLENTEQRVADLTVSADGVVKGSLRYVLSGQPALLWRQCTLRYDEAEVKKQFDEAMGRDVPQGVTAEFDHFLSLDDANTDLIAVIKVSGTLGTATGKRFFLPGLFFESRGSDPFVSEAKRTTPVDVEYPEQVKDTVTYRLPAGYSVESAPTATDVPWAKTAALRISAKADGNTVEVDRNLAYNFTLLDAKNYGPLHDFYQKVAAADQQEIVLKRQGVGSRE